jgi:Ca2+-binding RTX toxin-like protein
MNRWIVVALTVGAMLVAASMTASAGRRPECFGKPATIIGTDGDDQIEGTTGDDVILGGLGNDHILSGDGDDRVCGGRGWDHVEVGDGLDKATGGRARDAIDATDGQPGDVLYGGRHGDDQCAYNDGDTVCRCEDHVVEP